jgi:hypothetical protein
MRVIRGPQRRGVRLIIDMVAAQAPASAHEACGRATKRTFAVKYKAVAMICNRVAVPKNEAFGSKCGYTKCFKMKNEVECHHVVEASK